MLWCTGAVNHGLLRVRTASWLIMAAALLTGYSLAIADRASKERYEAKIQQIDGADPYEIPMVEWSEDLEDWSSITHGTCMPALPPTVLSNV